MKRNKLLAFFAVVIVAGVAVILFHLRYNLRQTPPVPVKISPEDAAADIQRRGEEFYRKRYYAPLIETYKKMLKKMPESVDLKKKLAFAYFGAGEYEKARPLLEEVERAGLADDEVRRELAHIRLLK